MTPINRITEHLRANGLTPVPPELRDDLHLIGLRVQIMQRLGHDVKLSPYLEVLLGLARDEARAEAHAVELAAIVCGR
jgi:hypothetical protein